MIYGICIFSDVTNSLELIQTPLPEFTGIYTGIRNSLDLGSIRDPFYVTWEFHK